MQEALTCRPCVICWDVSGLLRCLTLPSTLVPCIPALFLEMAQLSSYDSPDTPETDDSVEVRPALLPQAWSLGLASKGLGGLPKRLSEAGWAAAGRFAVSGHSDPEEEQQQAVAGRRAERMLGLQLPKRVASEKHACLPPFPASSRAVGHL